MENWYPQRDAFWPEEKLILSPEQPIQPLRIPAPAAPVHSRIETTTEPGKKAYTYWLGRLRSSPLYAPIRHEKAPNGFYAGRPIIGDLAQLHGGVYLGPQAQEAVVIDERSAWLKKTYEGLNRQLLLVKHLGEDLEQTCMREVVSLTCGILHYSFSDTQGLLRSQGVAPDEPIKLDLFIKEGLGAARHQVLLAGWLLERLKAKDVVRGYIFVDLDQRASGLEAERLVYVSRWGELIVFDPKSHHDGSL
jgi:hypothetical protein